jgi:hypothetical protein
VLSEELAKRLCARLLVHNLDVRELGVECDETSASSVVDSWYASVHSQGLHHVVESLLRKEGRTSAHHRFAEYQRCESRDVRRGHGSAGDVDVLASWSAREHVLANRAHVNFFVGVAPLGRR